MLISVIIPTFNDRRTLQQTVDCILNQSHRELEVIVVNDGGENPEDFLNSSDDRLRVINQPQNGGVSSARNAGFAKARGELVYFLDADDLAAPDLLEFAARAIDDSGSGILFVGKIDADDSEISSALKQLENESDRRLEALPRSDFYHLIKTKSGIFLPSAAIFDRSKLLTALGNEPWAKGLTHSEDTLLFMLLAYDTAVILCHHKFVVYRNRSDSASKKELASWKGRIKAMDFFLKYMRKRSAEPYIVSIGQDMRQNAARRVARMLETQGQRSEAVRILVDDLRKGPNLKSAVVLGLSLLRRIFRR